MSVLELTIEGPFWDDTWYFNVEAIVGDGEQALIQEDWEG
jgi:hypothetical protein